MQGTSPCDSASTKESSKRETQAPQQGSSNEPQAHEMKTKVKNRNVFDIFSDCVKIELETTVEQHAHKCKQGNRNLFNTFGTFIKTETEAPHSLKIEPQARDTRLVNKLKIETQAQGNNSERALNETHKESVLGGCVKVEVEQDEIVKNEPETRDRNIFSRLGERELEVPRSCQKHLNTKAEWRHGHVPCCDEGVVVKLEHFKVLDSTDEYLSTKTDSQQALKSKEAEHCPPASTETDPFRSKDTLLKEWSRLSDRQQGHTLALGSDTLNISTDQLSSGGGDDDYIVLSLSEVEQHDDRNKSEISRAPGRLKSENCVKMEEGIEGGGRQTVDDGKVIECERTECSAMETCRLLPENDNHEFDEDHYADNSEKDATLSATGATDENSKCLEDKNSMLLEDREDKDGDWLVINLDEESDEEIIDLTTKISSTLPTRERDVNLPVRHSMEETSALASGANGDSETVVTLDFHEGDEDDYSHSIVKTHKATRVERCTPFKEAGEDKATYSRNELRNFLFMEKSHKCSLCTASFFRLSSLEVHMDSFHDVSVGASGHSEPRRVGDGAEMSGKVGVQSNKGKAKRRGVKKIPGKGQGRKKAADRQKSNKRGGEVFGTEEIRTQQETDKGEGNRKRIRKSHGRTGRGGGEEEARAAKTAEDGIVPCQAQQGKESEPSEPRVHRGRQTRLQDGVRRYICRFCNQAKTDCKSLHCHVKTCTFAQVSSRTGSAPFMCGLCSQVFETAAELSRHFSSCHPSDRKFPCPSCTSSFDFRSDLTSHSKQHLLSRKWSCLYCNFRFATHYNRNLHMKHKHRDVLQLADLFTNASDVRQNRPKHTKQFIPRANPGQLIPVIQHRSSDLSGNINPSGLFDPRASCSHGTNLDLNPSIDPKSHSDLDSSNKDTGWNRNTARVSLGPNSDVNPDLDPKTVLANQCTTVELTGTNSKSDRIMSSDQLADLNRHTHLNVTEGCNQHVAGERLDLLQIFRCQICPNISFHTRFDLQTHFSYCHTNYSLRYSLRYECSYCQRIFGSLQILKEHQKTNHLLYSLDSESTEQQSKKRVYPF